MDSNIWFFDHNFAEDNEDDFDETSIRNSREARMIVLLAVYLVKQGYKPCQITILTF